MSSFQGNKCYKNMRVSVRALFILFCLTISTQVKKRRMKRNVTFCSLENLWVLHHKHLLGWHSCARMLSRFSCVRLFATLWTVACQAPLFMGFSKQEYWSGLPFLSPVDLPDLGIETASLVSPVLVGGFFITEASGKPMSPTRLPFNSSATCKPRLLPVLLMNWL